MPDDTTTVGGPDPSMYINMEEDYEVKDWAKSLGVTEHELAEAVVAVGNQVDKVREYLKR